MHKLLMKFVTYKFPYSLHSRAKSSTLTDFPFFQSIDQLLDHHRVVPSKHTTIAAYSLLNICSIPLCIAYVYMLIFGHSVALRPLYIPPLCSKITSRHYTTATTYLLLMETP